VMRRVFVWGVGAQRVRRVRLRLHLKRPHVAHRSEHESRLCKISLNSVWPANALPFLVEGCVSRVAFDRLVARGSDVAIPAYSRRTSGAPVTISAPVSALAVASSL
jgi:hypothetical protein